MSNKVKVTINSVSAVDKITDDIRIDINIGKINHKIVSDCSNKSIYEVIDDYVKSLGKSFGRDYQKDYNQYNGDNQTIRLCDVDPISRELARLDGYGLDICNNKLREYMLVITG